MPNINLESIHNVIVDTGNILYINDIMKKPNQNTSEELVDAINFTMKECLGYTSMNSQSDKSVVISRHNSNLKISEYELADLKIGFKIFLNTDNQTLLSEAIGKALTLLKVDAINDAIVTLKQKSSEDEKDDLQKIKSMWKVLEDLVEVGKIKQIGVADVEERTFKALHEWAKVKPSIIQVNLATCCIVPPTLQAFCKENDIKLLTHSDAADMLPAESIQNLFGKPLLLQWALRFSIHVKCRGVLTTKGYLLNFIKQ
ncbi:glutamate--cysteine ligase regulatory subunit isoform X1 [Diorhabda carinulata]|uniref:glutamate--cysteine ligase regulatory subunit isoform X1 n=2 Tax=Diorhabda carinulata TaxID=1163345 RepID=UPI0025A28A97|nr:glutamate--cysteine ligase regulatory subunit isoform X1 [Diorhabda carinulata]